MPRPELASLAPLGVPVSRQWLLDQGITTSRLDNALKSKKLVALAQGVYARPDLPVGWQGVIYGLQREQPGVVIGGLTALELQGRGHYVPLGQERTAIVYAPAEPPSWLRRLPLSLQVQWHSTARLWRDVAEPGQFCTQTYPWREDLPPLVMARPERAVLEILSRVPNGISFELADNLFQGLTTLSPTKLATTLSACNSIKAKRLFFWLAGRYGYAWSGRLDPNDYDLGSGKRVIAPGGRLDPRYLITVPEALYETR